MAHFSIPNYSIVQLNETRGGTSTKVAGAGLSGAGDAVYSTQTLVRIRYHATPGHEPHPLGALAREGIGNEKT